MRRAPALSVIAVLTLALTACTEGSEPSGLPSNAATPPATTAPTSTPPPRTPPTAPPEVTQQTDDGAKAAAKFFVQALEYFLNTGDPSVLRAASIAECNSCNSVVDRVSPLYTSGGHMVTEPYEITGLSIDENFESGAKAVAIHGIQPRREQFNASGVSISIEQPTPLTFSCIVVWTVDRWLVEEYKDRP